MKTNNKKHVSLLVALAMLIIYAVPFSSGVFAADNSPWAESVENYDSDIELMAIDGSLGLTTISEDYTFIASNFVTENITTATKFDNDKVLVLGNMGSKGTSEINGETYGNILRTKGSNNYIAFNVSGNATVTLYGKNSSSSAARYFAATTSLSSTNVKADNLAYSADDATVFAFEITEATTIYITSYNSADDSGGDAYIAGFTVEFNSDDDPSVTDSPKETDTPDATDTPTDTDTPDATDAPSVTDTPTDTDSPKETDTPDATTAPTDTEVPDVTETPTDAPIVTSQPDTATYTWKANKDVAADEVLMSGLTPLIDLTYSKGSNDFSDGTATDGYVSHSSTNGSWSNGAATGTALKFVAPAAGTFKVYMTNVSKNAYLIEENAVSSKSDLSESAALDSYMGTALGSANIILSCAVEKGHTYYVFVDGSKGRFCGASFTLDEGEEMPSPSPAPTADPSATEAPVLSSDEQDVMADAEALQLKAISQTAVYSDIDLDKTGANGSTITWESSDSRYIDIQTVSSINRNYTGVVTRPKEDECTEDGGVPVTLTATLTKGDAEYKKEFNVSVRKWNPNVYYNDFQTDVGQSAEGTYQAISDGVQAANGKDTFRGIRVDTLKESRCFADFSHQDQDTPTYFDKRIMSTEQGGANYGRPADSDTNDEENFAMYLSEYNAYGGSTTYTTLWINLIDPETGTAPAGIVMMTMDVYVIDGGNKLNMGFETSGQSQMCRFLLSNGSTTFKGTGFDQYAAAGYLRTFSNEASIDFMGGTSGYRHPTGKWVKATLIANSDTHKWDLYYDGMQICTGHDFRNAEDFVSTIEFTMDRSSSGGAYLIDNIYVENLTDDYADTYWDALMIDSIPYDETQDIYTAEKPFLLQYQGTDGVAGNAFSWSSSDSGVLSISTQRIAVEKLSEFGYTDEQIAEFKNSGYADVSVITATPNTSLTEDKIVTLTVKMQVGTELKKKTFNVLVKANAGQSAVSEDVEKARQDAEAISCVSAGEKISDDIDLETTGKINGSSITWKSSNTSVISTSGKVTRPTNASVTVTLTAAVKYGDAVEYKTFNVTVQPKSTASSGGGGGGGGSSSGSGGVTIASGGVTSTVTTANNVQTPAATVRPDGIPAFDDLDQAEWARDAIEYLFYKDVVNGYGDGRYGVNDDVTREQFVRMLMTALYIKLPETENNKFNDVVDNEWYTNYVNAAFELGIVAGISDDEFGIGQPISRQDMAVMCMRALDLITAEPELIEEHEETEEPEITEEPEGTEEPEATEEPEVTEEPEATEEPEVTEEIEATENIEETEEPEITEEPKPAISSEKLLTSLSFGDKDEIAEYAIEAIARMVEAGYLSGDDNGDFAPRKTSTRAETATVLYRIMLQEDI